MKQPNHYTQALAYLRDYCLRHGRLMYFSVNDIFETEGAAARLFGYIESGSFHYLVRNYEGDESTVETVAAGDLVGCYPYCLDGDAALVTPSAPTSPAPSMSSMVQTSMSTTARVRKRSEWAATTWPTA